MPIGYELLSGHVHSDRSKLELVLRGHLWMETLLNQLIEGKLTHPEAIQLDRTSFSAKLSLAHALGLIEDQVEALRHLNRLRNRLAHTLGGEPSIGEIGDLTSKLSGKARGIHDQFVAEQYEHLADGIATDEQASEALSVWLFVNISVLEFSRMQDEYEKKHQMPLRAYGQIVALHEQSGTPYSRDEIWETLGPPEARPTPQDIWTNVDTESPSDSLTHTVHGTERGPRPGH